MSTESNLVGLRLILLDWGNWDWVSLATLPECVGLILITVVCNNSGVKCFCLVSFGFCGPSAKV